MESGCLEKNYLFTCREYTGTRGFFQLIYPTRGFTIVHFADNGVSVKKVLVFSCNFPHGYVVRYHYVQTHSGYASHKM